MARAQQAALGRPGMDFEDERIALACAFRWAARFDMHEAVANHFSLDYPELGDDHFRELQEILDREDSSYRR